MCWRCIIENRELMDAVYGAQGAVEEQ